jgi:hypothetical protein
VTELVGFKTKILSPKIRKLDDFADLSDNARPNL